MTNNEIMKVKDLLCRANCVGQKCENCPYHYTAECINKADTHLLRKYVYELKDENNRQKAEIERLTAQRDKAVKDFTEFAQTAYENPFACNCCVNATENGKGCLWQGKHEGKRCLGRHFEYRGTLKEEIAPPYLLIKADAETAAEMKEILKRQKPVIIPDNEGIVIRIDKASIRAATVKEVIARVKEYFNPDISFEFRKWLDSLEKELVGETDV